MSAFWIASDQEVIGIEAHALNLRPGMTRERLGMTQRRPAVHFGRPVFCQKSETPRVGVPCRAKEGRDLVEKARHVRLTVGLARSGLP